MNSQNFSIFSFFRKLFKKETANTTFNVPQLEEDIDWEAVPNQ
jgi:hypothetical protein